jgi:LuxR family maltose regulon positive regulatory protein
LATPACRGKLLGMLKQTPEWRVLMLRAPAGYGKTTLMSLLFEHLGSAPATFCHWLTLDPCDEDPCTC